MTNAWIIEELEYFRNKNDIPTYALQIDAAWGAGKSHFIKDYIAKYTPGTPQDDEPMSVLISLFGVKSIPELERQIFSQVFSSSESAIGGAITSVIMSVAGFFKLEKGLVKPIDGAKDFFLQKRIERLKKGLIVFDDIERSGMPLKEALGFINRFVEKDGFRVVLISNEGALTRRDASDQDKADKAVLDSFREKVVGRSIVFRADPEAAFDALLSDMADDSARRVIESARKALILLFDESGRSNIRSLRAGFEGFDRVYRHLSAKITDKPEAVEYICLSFVCAALELGAGTEGEILSGSTVVSKSFSDSGLAERYASSYNFFNRVIPLKHVVEVLRTGRTNFDEMNASGEISPLVADVSDIPAWRSLIEIWDMNINDMERATTKALRSFEQLQVVDAGELLHLVGIMMWRERFGDLTLSGGLDPLKFTEAYLTKLQESGGYIQFGGDLRGFNRLAPYGYVVLSGDDGRIKHAQAAIRKSMSVGAEKQYIDVRNQLYEIFKQPDRDLTNTNFASYDIQRFIELPIFEGADPSDFADILMRDGSFDSSLLDWLISRYNQGHDEKLLIPERNWLSGLEREVSNRLLHVPNPLQKFWKQMLSTKLNRFLERDNA